MIGKKQEEILKHYAPKVQEGWIVRIVVMAYMPYTREFGEGYPVVIIADLDKPDEKVHETMPLSVIGNYDAAQNKSSELANRLSEIIRSLSRSRLLVIS